MPGSSTTLTDLATVILGYLSTVTGISLALDYEPVQLSATPAITLDGPSLRGTEPEESWSQLGATDWHTDWTVRVYVPADDPQVSTRTLRQVAGALRAAFDADETLGAAAGVLSAKLVELDWQPGELQEHGQPTRRLEGRLMVWSLV